MPAVEHDVLHFRTLSEMVDHLAGLINEERQTHKLSWVLASVNFDLNSLADIEYHPSMSEDYEMTLPVRHAIMQAIEPLLKQHYDFNDFQYFGRTVRINHGIATLLVDIVYRT